MFVWCCDAHMRHAARYWQSLGASTDVFRNRKYIAENSVLGGVKSIAKTLDGGRATVVLP